MKRIHNFSPGLFIVFFLTAVVSVSCDDLCFRDLCYDHSHIVSVDVRFDWRDCPDADPGTMDVWFYSLDTPASDPRHYDLPGKDGGTVRLRFGSYRVLCLNADTDAILYEGASTWEGFRLHTRRMDGNLIVEPNRMWASSKDEIGLEIGQENAEVVFTMSPRTLNLEIVLLNVPNIRYVRQLDASLSGMSASVGLVSGDQDDSHVSIPFEFTREGDCTLAARVETFGHCPGDLRPDSGTHLLTLRATLSDGSPWTCPVDITAEMHDPASMVDASHMRIVLDREIPVPEPIMGGSGLQPSVGGWDEEEIYVGTGIDH